jgi:hypothetical protein
MTPMGPDSHIVIGSDGTVLAAASQLTSDLVDVRLEDCEGLPPEIREAGTALLHHLRRSGDRIAIDSLVLDGGARTVRSGSRRMPGGTIHVGAGFDPARSQLTIEVQDDGPGIPADTVARLFKRDGLNVRGAGLALLMISDICAAHGGAVDLRSKTDAAEHGTAVRLSFPAR